MVVLILIALLRLGLGFVCCFVFVELDLWVISFLYLKWRRSSTADTRAFNVVKSIVGGESGGTWGRFDLFCRLGFGSVR